MKRRNFLKLIPAAIAIPIIAKHLPAQVVEPETTFIFGSGELFLVNDAATHVISIGTVSNVKVTLDGEQRCGATKRTRTGATKCCIRSKVPTRKRCRLHGGGPTPNGH